VDNRGNISGLKNKARILIVDDDIVVRKFVGANLIARGYQVLMAANGEEALTIFEAHPLEMIILDLFMPALDGFAVCRQIRQKSSVPIIILSAAAGEDELVRCMEMGADDFIAKPFSLPELLARIRAILRRYRLTAPVRSAFNSGDLEIDFENRTVSLKKQNVDLTAHEFSILYYLALNAGKPVSCDYLLNNVWGPQYTANNRILWVNISRLRKKLQNQASIESYVHHRVGQGYLLNSGTFTF
jgi:two-component system KDP operon response regulator KdpE